MSADPAFDAQFETAAALAYAKFAHVLPLVDYDSFKLIFGAGALWESNRVCDRYADPLAEEPRR